MTYSLPFHKDGQIIEIGGGEKPVKKHATGKASDYNVVAGNRYIISGDLSEELPYEDGVFDGVISSYAIEQVSWRKVRYFIQEVYRILRVGGKAVFITANLKEQAKKLVNTEEWTDNEVSMIFGEQDFVAGNMHLAGFSEQFAMKLFREAGFTHVMVMPHPDKITDMIIEVSKNVKIEDPNTWDTQRRTQAFGYDYFNGGKLLGGYPKEGYWDLPSNQKVFNYLKSLSPESVLELGCARGYILKRLEDSGIKTTGLEVSKHCFYTRVCDNIITWDITSTPWPYADKSIDLAYSMSVLEHIPEQYISAVAYELERVCRRGVHGFKLVEDETDTTQITNHDMQWWVERLPISHKTMSVEAIEKAGGVELAVDDGLTKLNIGNGATMFHHGWLNIDDKNLTEFAYKYEYKFLQHDVTKDLYFENDSVHIIYASHILQKLPPRTGIKFLKECHRVLKQGGFIRLAVSDTKLLMGKYLTNTLSDLDEVSDVNSRVGNSSFKLWNLLTSQNSITYDQDSLVDVLNKAGFTDIYKYKFRGSGSEIMRRETFDMCPEHSIYIEAVKG